MKNLHFASIEKEILKTFVPQIWSQIELHLAEKNVTILKFKRKSDTELDSKIRLQRCMM
jgi:hypothetical protein